MAGAGTSWALLQVGLTGSAIFAWVARPAGSTVRAMDEEDGYFGESVAATYDLSLAELFEPEVVVPAVDVLVELAAGGRVLELGIGTGRIALPLVDRGVPVHGIELSRAMVDRLRAKPARSM